MGYTHYFSTTKTATQEQWDAFTKKAKEIIDAFGTVYNWDGTIEGVEMDECMIRLNGCAENGESHETFLIDFNSGEWTFCKTARKPYDAVCVALLMVGVEMGIIKDWSSDGDGEDFAEAKELLAKVGETPKEVMYDHAFTIAFSLRNTDPEGNATAQELMVALFKRLASIAENDLDELIEACGAPFDTYEVD